MHWLGIGGVMMHLLAPSAARAADQSPIASPWFPLDNARARLVAGGAPGPDGQVRLFGGIEIEMADGWKTYWRNPGSSGVAPRLDTAGSANLVGARLLFPAPTRFVDRDGDTLGYKHAVTFPLTIVPKDPTKPVDLNVTIEFGICRDICIPAEVKLRLLLPADAAKVAASEQLAQALAHVPRPASARRPGDPRIAGLKVDWGPPSPRVVVEAVFPGGTQGADLFAEAPDGLWVPLPRKTGEASGGIVRFEIDLTDGVDVAELKGKELLLTLVSDAGQSEASVTLK